MSPENGDFPVNMQMDSPLFFGFVQHIAIGTASVFVLFLVVWATTPAGTQRSQVKRTPR